MRFPTLLLVPGLLLLLAQGCPAPASAPQDAPEHPSETQPSETQPSETQPSASDEENAAPQARPEVPPDLEDGETGHFGAEFTLAETDRIDIPTALESCTGTGELCRVEARIASVCQNRGCWFTIESDATDDTIRVRMHDYGFFVPMNTGGADVELEGRLERRLVPVDEVQHYAEDEARAAGEDAEVPEITEPEYTWEFMATAVRITR